MVKRNFFFGLHGGVSFQVCGRLGIDSVTERKQNYNYFIEDGIGRFSCQG